MAATAAAFVTALGLLAATPGQASAQGDIPIYGSVLGEYHAVATQMALNANTWVAQIAADPQIAARNAIINSTNPSFVAAATVGPIINSVAALHASVVNIVSSSNPKQALQYILITPALVTDGIWNGGYARLAVNDGVPDYAGGLINQPYTSTYPSVLHTVRSGAGPAFTSQVQPRKHSNALKSRTGQVAPSGARVGKSRRSDDQTVRRGSGDVLQTATPQLR